MDLDAEQFLNLSYYEWCLAVYRFKKRNERLRLQNESQWLHTRLMVATLCNVNRAPNTPAIEQTDIIRLSFDKEPEVIVPEDNLMEILKEKYK